MKKNMFFIMPFTVLAIISGVGSFVFSIWALVEFILYLFKDDPFNWSVLYWCIASYVVAIICSVYMAINK